ncbi:RNase P subunit p30-domain-containing protein, partial [Gaertneriomyces semiglobifer]
LSSYDLIALQPTTERLFQIACNNLDIDIISLEMSARLPFFLKHSTINAAIQRGVYFEICYSAAIRDVTARKHLISNAAALVRVTKGKNILITSGAEKALELRGPHDVINLGSIFSMNQTLTKSSIMDNCRSILFHSATRRKTMRGVISMETPSLRIPPARTTKLQQSDDPMEC